uniref:VEGF related ligand n=1 Tax=Clytia hemisphaerica TaxID=252671 RepID=A0A069DLY1_9CNID
MRISSVFVLLVFVSLCLAKKGYYRKIQDGRFKPVRVIRPKVVTQFDKNKMEVANKMKKVKNMEDFLRVFKVPYVKKRRISLAKPQGETHTFLETHTLLGTTDSDSKLEAPEFEFFIKKPTIGKEQSLVGESNRHTILGTSEKSSESVKLSDEDLGCQPRPTIYSLTASHNYFDYPSCFTLYQCGGCCNSKPGNICRPTELSVKTVSHVRLSYITNRYTQETVRLNHHKKCECRCKIDATDCSPTQTFDPNLCTCVCSGQLQPCAENKVWSNNECGCLCKTSPQRCPFRKEWDKTKCSCQCIPKKCGVGESQDPTTCYCAKI